MPPLSPSTPSGSVPGRGGLRSLTADRQPADCNAVVEATPESSARSDPYVVTRLSDEEWIAAARRQVELGGEPWGIRPATGTAETPGTPTQPGPQCPACKDRPALAVFRRFSSPSVTPLRFCNRCYGFWAAGDALSFGVAHPGESHPALEAVPGPRRCRACFGHLDAQGACTKCGWTAPLYRCPACDVPMTRIPAPVTVDRCEPCQGTWFDVGEIGAVYRFEPRMSLAASVAGRREETEEPQTGAELALSLAAQVLRVLLG